MECQIKHLIARWKEFLILKSSMAVDALKNNLEKLSTIF